ACEEPEGDEEPYQHGVCASNLSHGTSSCHGSMDESTAPALAYQRRVPEAMPALSTVLRAGRDVSPPPRKRWWAMRRILRLKLEEEVGQGFSGRAEKLAQGKNRSWA